MFQSASISQPAERIDIQKGAVPLDRSEQRHCVKVLEGLNAMHVVLIFLFLTAITAYSTPNKVLYPPVHPTPGQPGGLPYFFHHKVRCCLEQVLSAETCCLMALRPDGTACSSCGFVTAISFCCSASPGGTMEVHCTMAPVPQQQHSRTVCLQQAMLCTTKLHILIE
jgi:hypothetical protein